MYKLLWKEKGAWFLPVAITCQPSQNDLLPLRLYFMSSNISAASNITATNTPARYTITNHCCQWMVVDSGVPADTIFCFAIITCSYLVDFHWSAMTPPSQKV